MNIWKLGVLAGGVLMAVSCTSKKAEIPALNLSYMDSTVHVGDDFYRHVNGTWLDETLIPEDRSRWGSFNELRKSTDITVMDILSNLLKKSNMSSDEKKVFAMYQTFMDSAKRDEIGIEPIKPWLNKISAITSLEDVQDVLIELEPVTSSPLFSFGVRPKFSDSNINILGLRGGSTGLPEREYYLSQDSTEVDIRKKYVDFASKMLQLTGKSTDDANAMAQSVLEFETKLEQAKLTKEERRDTRKLDNFIAVSDLQKMASNIDWSNHLSQLKFDTDSLNVSQPKYIKAVNDLFTESNIDVIKSYMYWTVVKGSASYLTMEMDRLNFDFYGKTLRGQKVQRKADERVISTINRTVGEVLGKLYVEEAFPAEAKKVANDMVNELLDATEERINALEWMSATTKEKAVEKLRSLNVKIGYPDNWTDYSELELKSIDEGGNLLENMASVNKWSFEDNRKDLNQKVDKTKWFMTPQTVNAYYNPLFNEIVFPAAIMQPPFFNFKADAAVNFGGMGAVIGHEISHGFDDSGSRYDSKGNLNNWWTDEDREKFDLLVKKLADQYSAYEPLPGVFVNGEFTSGENIGDLGGVNIALTGLKNYLAKNPTEDIDGLNPYQRFFMSWATIWRSKSTDEALKNQIKTDPHSPGRYRAVGPVINVDEFYKEFGVTPEHKLFKEKDKRIKIW